MFKKILVLLGLSMLFLSLVGKGQEPKPQAVFDQANLQLQQGNISQALEVYNQLEGQNHLSGALFLNMGLSYVQVDSMGKAKFYFLKAKEFEETEERAIEGLTYVENKFSRQSAVLPTLPWQEALNWLQENVGATILLSIGLLLLNLGIFLYITLWFPKNRKSFLSNSAISSAIAGALIVLLSFYVDYRAGRYHHAVMITQETTVREQPNADASIISQAFEGYTFSVDRHKSKEQEQWSYIQMSNGQYGWISTSAIMTF